MAFIYKLLVKFISTKAWVYLVMICNSITVVRCLRLIVLNLRGKPYSGNAKIFKVIEVVYDALDISAMTAKHRIAVQAGFAHAFYYIIRRVAVREAVGHN